MRSFKRFIALVGRLFFSSVFILSAVNKIFDWQKTESGLINLFCDWQVYVNFSKHLSKMFSSLISWVPEILIAITVIELIAALLIFFGIKEKFGAFLLFIFFFPATFLLHPFWFLSGAKRSFETIMFMKNLALIGSLLIFMIRGSKIRKHPSHDDHEHRHEEDVEQEQSPQMHEE